MGHDGAKQFKIAYAVTTGGCDVYSSMPLISASTVRLTNPRATITVVCDQKSLEAMRACQDRLLDAADEVISLEVPEGLAPMRSRFVKTRLGSVVEGAFLFLDSDTVVRKCLSALFYSTADVAAARNHSRRILHEQMWDCDQEIFQKMSWPVPTDHYLNSGVIFYAGNRASREFAKTWHQLWQQSYASTGDHRDQAAFNYALRMSGSRCEVLPDTFNAQIKSRHVFKAESLDEKRRSTLERDAAIWHVYAAMHGGAAETALEHLAARCVSSQKLTEQDVRSLIRTKHPWRRDDVLDDWVAQVMRRQETTAAWSRMWMGGRRLGAIKALLLQSLHSTNAGKLLPEA